MRFWATSERRWTTTSGSPASSTRRSTRTRAARSRTSPSSTRWRRAARRRRSTASRTSSSRRRPRSSRAREPADPRHRRHGQADHREPRPRYDHQHPLRNAEPLHSLRPLRPRPLRGGGRLPRLSRLHPPRQAASSGRASRPTRGGASPRSACATRLRSSCRTSRTFPRASSRGSPSSTGRRSGSLAYLPLVIDDRAIGVLTVQSEARGAITTRHLTLMEALAPYVAIAVENSLIHDRLETLNRAIRGEKEELEKAAVSITHLANHDPLTGLPNRRLLFELLQNTFAVARAQRHQGRLDLRRPRRLQADQRQARPPGGRQGPRRRSPSAFAQCSERRTPSRGSAATSSSPSSRRSGTRRTSPSPRGRYSRSAANPSRVEGEECRVGFSMGIAVFPDDGDSIEAIVSAADEAMYRVKRAYQERLRLRRRPSPGSTRRSLTGQAKGRDNLRPRSQGRKSWHPRHQKSL